MNRRLILYFPYIQEYLYNILNSGIELNGFVLYGSIVSDEMSRTSDIDIKIFARREADVKAIESIENKINKKIISDDFSNLLHSIVSIRPEPEHIENGILLYGKPIEIKAGKEKLTEMEIITYNATGLTKNKRAKFAIRLFGHKTRRTEGSKIRIYETKGVLELYGGKPLRNGILIDTKSSGKIVRILKEMGVEHKTSTVYLPEFSDFLER